MHKQDRVQNYDPGRTILYTILHVTQGFLHIITKLTNHD